MAQFSCLSGDAKKDSFTALEASLHFYIEDIALFAFADSDLQRHLLPGGSPAVDVYLSHSLFKLITFCD